jgi:hypothetical protein
VADSAKSSCAHHGGCGTACRGRSSFHKRELVMSVIDKKNQQY